MTKSNARPGFKRQYSLDINENPKDDQAWAKLPPEEMVRGKMPMDTEKRCLELVRDYIAGSWLNATSVSDITVKRISGGFTNQLYHVHLNSAVPRSPNATYPDEPSDVAIKFYLEKHIKNYDQSTSERLNDEIILTIMSQTGLGPKIYGIFADGFIQGYYPHEQFRAKHQENPVLLHRLASVLARIHHLSVPMPKQRNLLFKEMRQMIHFGYDHCQAEKYISVLDLATFKERDLRLEFEWAIKLVDSLESPIVFCHNDFRGANILATLSDTTPEREVLVCDLEYAGYGSRSYDLATFLMEWGKTEIFQLTGPRPTDEQLSEFLKLYIAECDKVVPGYADKPENQLSVLLRETKVMLLVNLLFFLSVMIQTQESFIPAFIIYDPVKKMIQLEILYKAYMEMKEGLIQEGSIKRENI